MAAPGIDRHMVRAIERLAKAIEESNRIHHLKLSGQSVRRPPPTPDLPDHATMPPGPGDDAA